MSERLILEYMFYNCFSLIAVYLLSAHLHLYLFTWTILLVSFWLHRPEACGQTQSLFQQWPKILSCWHYFSLSSSLFNKPSGLLIVAIVVFLCMFVCVCVCADFHQFTLESCTAWSWLCQLWSPCCSTRAPYWSKCGLEETRSGSV